LVVLFLHGSPVAVVTIPGIRAVVTFRMGWISVIALEALAMLPASALGVIFTPFGVGFARVAM